MLSKNVLKNVLQECPENIKALKRKGEALYLVILVIVIGNVYPLALDRTRR